MARSRHGHDREENTVKARIKLLLPACLLIPMFASGQGVPRGAATRYGLTLGVAFYQVRDEALNPIRHQGPSVSAGVFRERASTDSMHRFGISFTFAPLTDRYSPDRSSILFHPAVEFRYVRKTAQPTEDLALFLGGTMGWNTRFGFYENWDQGHPYWLTSAHLGFAGSLVRTLNDGKSLQLDLDSPLVALVSRPPERFEYKEVNPDPGWVFKEIHRDLRPAAFSQHTAVTATLTFHNTGGRFLQRVFWQTAFAATRLPQSKPFTSLSHILGISHLF
jgi:hypothetical protein